MNRHGEFECKSTGDESVKRCRIGGVLPKSWRFFRAPASLCRILPGILLFFLVLHTASIAQAQPFEFDFRESYIDERPYEMPSYDSEVIAGSYGSVTPFYWVDDNTLIFTGHYPLDGPDGPMPRTRDQARGMNGYKFLWTVGEGTEEIMMYRNYNEILYKMWICGEGGIAYSSNGRISDLRNGANPTRLVGPPGSMREIVSEDLMNASGGFPITYMPGGGRRCTLIDRPDLIDLNWYELGQGDGILINGSREKRGTNTYPWIWLSEDGSDYWIFPQEFIQNSGALLQWYKSIRPIRFEGSYQFYYSKRVIERWNQEYIQRYEHELTEKCEYLYYFFPDTKELKRRCFPVGPWTGYTSDVSLTKMGLVFSMKSKAYFKKGLFLVLGREVFRIQDNVVDTFKVSPNGCRVAYFYADWKWDFLFPGTNSPPSIIDNRNAPGWRLRVLDLCDLGEET